MALREVALLAAALPLFAAAQSTAIRLNQAGYLPGLPKLAVVDASASGPFTLHHAATGRIVFRATLAPPAASADAGQQVRTADFSAFNKAGRYYLAAEGAGRSPEFTIGPAAYRRAFYLAMRSYYGQRCGIAVNLGDEFPGFSHEACHLTGAFHSSSGLSGPAPSTKGWHDAGDYGRYVVNSGITTGTLLWAFELYKPRLAKIKLNIPESRNSTPDILDEIRWNLDWMLSMQHASGGVFHKQTSEKFCGFIMPEKDDLPSLVIGPGKEPGPSSCATADFAAVMAIAARVYTPYDAAFSERALLAARAAWAWLALHPKVLFMNPPGVSTGAYGDRDCSDERLWAAAELFRTTREAPFHDYFLANWRTHQSTLRPANPPSWASVGALALWTYALARPAGPDAAEIVQLATSAANAIADRTAADPYRTSMTARDYIWGSNAVAANYGVQLLVAATLAPDPRYKAAALDNLHYLLGRNPLSLSYLTGVGARSVMHPHHRPSGADSNPTPWPGLLAGGPNARRQDPAMKALPPDTPPARMFLDDQESYATNEIAINWNAPLVFLLAAAQ